MQSNHTVRARVTVCGCRCEQETKIFYTVRILNLCLVLTSRTESLPVGSRLDKKFVWMSRLSCKQVGDWFVDV